MKVKEISANEFSLSSYDYGEEKVLKVAQTADVSKQLTALNLVIRKATKKSEDKLARSVKRAARYRLR